MMENIFGCLEDNCAAISSILTTYGSTIPILIVGPVTHSRSIAI
jgi:hypothetical protein